MQGDIFIYGGIGTERNEISFENVKAQIAQNKDAEELILHIISPGGDVFEGYSIYNALLNTGKTIRTQIEGTCASIATLIAGAGDSIVMNRTAQFMIHNPKVSGFNRDADAKELRNVANQLDQIKTLLIDVYDRKTSLGKEKLWELYDNETWLTAQDAQKMGFIDEVQDAIKAVAKINLPKIKNDMRDSNLINSIIDRISNGLKSLKIKNEMVETLQDGTKIIVMTEDEDWTGKQVIYEDGTPLPVGEHTLASGKVVVVGDANGTITEVKDAVVDNTNTEEEMKKDEEIANLKAQLAEAQAKADQAVAQVTTAEAKAIKFENRIKSIEQDFIKLKEEALQTVGDKTEPTKGPVFKNANNGAEYDPMGDDAMKFYKNRNLIKNED